MLSRTEEIVLLAIWQLQDEAYGVAILEKIKAMTGKDWTFGAIYAPLHRLEKRRLVASLRGAPLPERGGRFRVYYKVTPAGLDSMADAKAVHEAIWKDAPWPKRTKA